jgi:hypothetical protein
LIFLDKKNELMAYRQEITNIIAVFVLESQKKEQEKHLKWTLNEL